jgi:acetolactate synthase I/II/III large subunit
MNGAQALLKTLVAAGVDVCFMNPGTSEMHFVAALDSVPAMRSVLGLFEGVLTGAADGYARMADKPAATLLHLGPGLTNSLANVHNARRARVPMVNIVGEHATYHKQYDAPLSSDVEGLARPMSDFLRVSQSVTALANDTAETVAAARSAPGKIATLVLPADVSWSEGAEPAKPISVAPAARVADSTVRAVADVLGRGEKCVLLMNGRALRDAGLHAASRIGSTTGARVMSDTFSTRTQRGAGRATIERMPYFAEMAADELKDVKHAVLVGTNAPVAFFAYPGKPSYLLPEGCQVHVLAAPNEDAVDALQNLADLIRAPKDSARIQLAQRCDAPTGAMSSHAVALAVGATMPEGTVVVDEGNTEGFIVPFTTLGAPAHDWLTNTGGSIGIAIPMSIGAAIASPGRKVLCLEGDGSAMYTIQGLWTQAREKLDIVTIIFANRSYRILNIELTRVGAEAAGDRAKEMLDIARPTLDFVAIARGMGVDACRPETAEELTAALKRAFAEPGPHLIECVV